MEKWLETLMCNVAFEEKMVKGARLLLEGLNEVTGNTIDLKNDENFKKTPYRIAKSYLEMCEGLSQINEVEEILQTNFPSDYKGMVIIDSIDAFSICPHHALPVKYLIDFGYIPKEKMLGLSKIPRFIKLLAKRPVLQEDFTKQIIEFFVKHVYPLGAIVTMRGVHNCIVCRGVGAVNSGAVTSEVYGNFADLDTRTEFLQLIQNKKM
jgi:GTP cyclohydrolase I